MEKMKRIAKGLDVVSIILFVILAAALVALAVGGVALFAVCLRSEKLLMLEEIKLPGIPGIVDATVTDPAAFVRFCIAGMLLGALFMVGMLWIVHIIRRILSPMKEGRPFAGSVSRDIRTLGWIDLGFGVVNMIISGVMGRLLTKAVSVSSGSYTFPFSLNFLLTAAVLFLFSYIFHYGEMLQQQADETL